MIRPIKNLIIVGLGKSIYDWVNHTWANFDQIGDVWTINAGAACFRHDVIFDMHTDEFIAGLDSATKGRVQRRREWLKKHDRPIVMPKALPDYPTSITYPLKQVIEITNSCYFGTGLAYPLALAFCCGVENLMMFGCDFSYDRNTNSHDEQGRACAEYWTGRLIQKGVHVGLSSNTHFMDGFKRSKGKIYGYHEPVMMDFPIEGGRGKFVAPDYT